MYIKSGECNDYFKSGMPYHFKIHLKSPLVLKGFGTVGLLEFYCIASSKPKLDNVLHLFCNLSKECIINGELKPLLRRIPSSEKNQWMHSFSSPFYLRVVKKRNL